ncbi:MAG: nucleotidyltransferase family protein [Bacteroidetes bacterium]|nr:MAG: nucleotidyltransferase family protein [Bacteroidota bacterium]
MQAMILSAGLGTRLKPFTDHHPKALAMVNGKTVLQRNVEYLQQFGITNVVVNVHHFAQQIITAIEEAKGWGSHITISNETTEILETGGGIKKAAPFLTQSPNCLIMNVDVLTTLDVDALIDHHNSSQALATLATTNRASSRQLLFNKQGLLSGWKNNASGEVKPTDLLNHTSMASLQPQAFSGIQIVSKSLFKHIAFNGKFSMIDVYLDLCTRFRIVSFDHSHGEFIDIGTPEKLEHAAGTFA